MLNGYSTGKEHRPLLYSVREEQHIKSLRRICVLRYAAFIKFYILNPMTNFFPRSFLLYFLLNCSVALPSIAQEKKFSADELREDFMFMRERMEANNPNLYLYVTKTSLDSVFGNLCNGINGPMTAREFYTYITPVNAIIKDGHNAMLPDEKERNKSLQSDLYFPFNFFEAGNRFYITMNLSYDSTIHAGDELLTLNGKPVSEIYGYLLERTMRDGYNMAYPRYIISTYFRSYYSFCFGYPDKYSLSFRTQHGDTIEKIIDAVPYSYLKKIRNEKYAGRYDRTEFGKAIFWQTDSLRKYCVLSIKSWDTKFVRSVYDQHIKAAIDAFIAELRVAGPENLVIDLRGNQGGDAENGIYLLQYLADKPFQYLASVKKYNSSGKLVNDDARLTKIFQPNSYHYPGKVYILTDGGSFSNSAIFASQVKRSGRGILVGEETGGNGIILSGGDDYYALPHTRISILDLTHQYISAAVSENKGRGVEPDIPVSRTPAGVVQNKDEVLDYVIGLINGKK